MKVLLTIAGIVAGLVAALYGVNAWLAAAAERAAPPQGRTERVDGLDLHFVEAGRGVPVLLIHGANGTLRDFTATVFDRLAERYRVVAVDRPGHGYSERAATAMPPGEQARLLHALAGRLGLERPVVVGFSYGSALALSYGLDYPGDVRAVVTLAPVAHPWPDPIDWKWRMPTWPVVGRFVFDTVPQIVGRFIKDEALRNAFAPEPVAPAYANGPYGMMLRPEQFRANAEDIRLLKPALAAMAPRYAGLRPPLVILTGDSDNVVSARIHARPLHEKVADSELTVIEGAGHLLPYTRPEAVLAAVDRAVARSTAAAAAQ